MTRPRPRGGEASLFPEGEPPSAVPRDTVHRGFFVEVALARPLRCEFTYRVPEAFAERARPGVRVRVPFRAKRAALGVVVRSARETSLPPERLKSVLEVVDTEPVVDAVQLELARWIAERYACSWGEALAAVLPAVLKRDSHRRTVLVASAVPGLAKERLAEIEASSPKQHRVLRTLIDAGGPLELHGLCARLGLSDSPARTLARKGLVSLRRVPAAADALTESIALRERPDVLLPEQVRAVEAAVAALRTRRGGAFLLHGVTGSGKTEVYLRVIEEALAQGRGAIVLVPEIALTPQTVGWFRSRFSDVAVLHSRMSDGARYETWMRVRSGRTRVVVGARSAIFAPACDLGVIVVDEEHEPSFKQGSVPRYHARDVALERARMQGAVCILGSATPALETWHAAQQGRIERLSLPRRVHGGALPEVEVVDMRLEKAERGEFLIFSRRLRTLLAETLERGEQSIVFLNRRGFSPVQWCRACGETVKCRQCTRAMTFHRGIQRLVCHFCCDEDRPHEECPSCTAPRLEFLGIGTQRVELALRRLLPEARIRRMDSDTMLRREDYERELAAFGSGQTDVLVGTQMIAKGLDFPRVTLVGIVLADQALGIPDFRSSERTFQLVAQVAGRAGRGSLVGRIVVQTRRPDHHSIQQAARHDYETFARLEMADRAATGYPPYGRIARVIFEDEDGERAGRASLRAAEHLRSRTRATQIQIVQSVAPIARVRGRYRYHILIRARRAEDLDPVVPMLAELAAGRSRPRVTVDIDAIALG